MQIFTIVASRGNVYLLASLYAFGVIWSFSFMSLAVVVLRYTSPENREWKVPGNIHIKGVEIPVGLIAHFVDPVLHCDRESVHQAVGDHRRRQPSVLVFFVIFTISERKTAHQHATGESGLEQFNVARTGTQRRNHGSAAWQYPGGGPRSSQSVLPPAGAGQDRHHQDRRGGHDRRACTIASTPLVASDVVETSEVFKKYERELFTSVVNVAEKEGKHVSLLVVPTNDVFESIVATAQRLHSSVVICGLSNKLTADEQGKLTGDAWERLPGAASAIAVDRGRAQRHQVTNTCWARTVRACGRKTWTCCTACGRKPPPIRAIRDLHHYHVLNVALQEMKDRMHNDGYRDEVMKDIYDEMQRNGGAPVDDDDSVPPSP